MDINQIPALPDNEPELRHPSPEQLMLREAVKRLTPAQKKVWDLHNFDRLTQEEIAKKLGKKRTTIQTQIGQCEKKIAKWVKNNLGAYKLLKSDLGEGL